MPADARVAAARQALGAELNRLRHDAGMSIRQLGRAGVPVGGTAPIPHARIPRIESGEAVPTDAQVRHWLAAAGAGQAARERVAALLRDVRSESSRWADLLALTGDRDLQQLAAEREQAATAIDSACQQWIPGLLQTRDYARALFGRLERDGYPVEADASTDRRMARQAMLDAEDRRFRFLLTPRAVAWNPDADTVSMTEQRQRLRDMDERAVAEVRVLADDASPVGPWASFTLHDGDRPAVTIELEHRNELVIADEDVARYRRRFREMWDAAHRL